MGTSSSGRISDAAAWLARRPWSYAGKDAPFEVIHRLIFAILVALLLAVPANARAKERYSATVNGDIVQLRDGDADLVVSILTPVANAYEMVIHGHDVIRMGIQSVDAMRANPGLNGIPLLAPFANRLDGTYFYANGRKYNFDLENGTVRGPVPIHGYVSGAPGWTVVEVKADDKAAWITERLDFYKYPLFMHNFPFAHVLTRTYRVSDGSLEVGLQLDNLSNEPMPVSIGYHPFFWLTDSNRSDWTLSVPARTHWLLTDAKLPTGKTEAADVFWQGDRHDIPLSRFADRTIDDLFSDLERDAEGRTTAHLQGKRQGLSVIIGPKFKALVIYSPPAPAPPRPAGALPAGPRPQSPPVSTGPALPLSSTDQSPVPPERGSIAIEPMAGISNAMNAAQEGTYNELQSVPPGGSWNESFWLKPTGY